MNTMTEKRPDTENVKRCKARYRENNLSKYANYSKIHYEANKDAINARRRELRRLKKESNN